MNRRIKRGLTRPVFIVILSFFSGFSLSAQDDYATLEKEIRLLADSIPALQAEVNTSFSNVSIQEFLRAVANSSGLNLNVSPDLNITVVNNYSQVKVVDLLLYLCKEHDLRLSYIGNIFTLYKPHKEIVNEPYNPGIERDESTGWVSLNYSNRTMDEVSREITRITGENIILAPGLTAIKVSGYVLNRPLDQALEKFAFSNNLKTEKTQDGFFIVKSAEQKGQPDMKATSQPFRNGRKFGPSEIKAMGEDSININVFDTPIADIINEISDQLGLDYVFVDVPEGNVNLRAMGVSYADLLTHLFYGTLYTFRKQDGNYIFGKTGEYEMQMTKLIKLQFRPADSLKYIIPESLKEGIEIKEYTELNSILLNGPEPGVLALEDFIRSVDQTVPVVMIELMIVDVSKNFTIATGIQAGVGQPPKPHKQTILPGVDYQLSTKTINSLIESFNGFASTNIGKVNSNFYLGIKALEDNGYLKIRSMPKLSTLNSHAASLSSGETKYYKEERTNYIGSLNPGIANSYEWKSVEAKLEIKIRPIVSGDEQITLKITVEQSEFTPREYEDAPPGSITRTFESAIRVKNQEMVLLGGLEREISSETSSGIPLLARIPVIKWFFSSRTKENSDSRLNIFIKPTILN